MKYASEQFDWPEGSIPRFGTNDEMVLSLLRRGQPVTRENWLLTAFRSESPPDPVPAEIEETMPPQLRLNPFEDDPDEWLPLAQAGARGSAGDPA